MIDLRSDPERVSGDECGYIPVYDTKNANGCAELHRRRHCCHPVEAVDHGEDGEGHDIEVREWQVEQQRPGSP
jgi:hypothetical protein